MANKIFGIRNDGTMALCRALPENRGHGNCPHGEHVELSEEQLKTGFLKTFNEEAIRKTMETLGESGFAALNQKKPAESSNARKKRSMETLAKLRAEADELEKTFTQEDYDLVHSVYSDFARVTEAGELDEETSKSRLMENYLTSDEPVAVKLREYLGEDADYSAIADLLVNDVGGMTSAHRWSTSGRHSISRVLLTNLNNDMTKENYMTAVLYFKGKCCYCEKGLSRNPGGKVALPTGEHITPITPSRPGGPVGGTRFGNVALACNRCNKSRANEDLHLWLKMDGAPIPMDRRGAALARVNSFRKFSGYKEYTSEETELIRESASRVQLDVDAMRDENGKLVRGTGAGELIRDKLVAEVATLETRIPGRKQS